jgi:transcriptional regulator with XRE-family HTH domain
MSNDKLYSRESTAELLGISSSTLANYELGVTKVVPPDAVVMMADLYRAPELKNHYCANDCPIGRGTPIPTSVSSIELATIKIIKAFSLEDAEAAKKKLVDIAADGQITPEEIPSLEWVLGYLDATSRAIGELRLVCHKALGGIVKEGES